jgi:DNA-binding NtrC family response regulator
MDLDRQISKGAFRKDLYYRLKGALLHLPPLRERKEDIPLLAMNILKEIPRGKGLTVDEEALGLLIDYDYPGNVRELKSILQSAANLAKDGILDIKSLPPTFVQRRRSTSTGKSMQGQEAILPLGEVEKAHILKIYDQTNKNKTQTADLLKIGLNTLRRKLDSYGVD